MNKKYVYAFLLGCFAILCIAAMPTSINFNQFGSGGVLYLTNNWNSTNGVFRGTNKFFAIQMTNGQGVGKVLTDTNGDGIFTWQTPSGGGTAFNPNQFTTNAGVVSAITGFPATNANFNGSFTNTGGANITGGITNGVLTSGAFVYADANKKLTSTTNIVESSGILNTRSQFAANSTNDFVLNTRYTNGLNRAFVAATVRLDPTGSVTLQEVSLYVEQNGKTNIVKSACGASLNDFVDRELSILVDPNAPFYFTNTIGSDSQVISGTSSKIDF